MKGKKDMEKEQMRNKENEIYKKRGREREGLDDNEICQCTWHRKEETCWHQDLSWFRVQYCQKKNARAFSQNGE